MSLGKISTEKQSIDVDDYRLELLRLEGENKSLKELTNDAALVASKKKIETLQAMNNFLKSEKDELVLQIAAKNKKIEILERRVKELTDMKTNEINGSKNGVCGEADDYINELDEELGKTKHKVAELEVSVVHRKFILSRSRVKVVKSNSGLLNVIVTIVIPMFIMMIFL